MITNTKSDLLSTYSDVYKEIHGIRPRFLSLEMTEEELQRRLDGLMEDHKMHMDECRRNDAESDLLYETEVAKMIKIGARDEKNAILWMMQADGINPSDYYDVEKWMHDSGFTWKTQNKIKKILDI